MLNILFMRTTDFAMESVDSLYTSGYNILGVVTNVDKPKGRGMKLYPSPVKEYALDKDIKIFQPEKVKNNPEFIEQIKALNPDIICVVAYGKILPKEILDIPKYGCINVHASLLPKYRGAAPIQWAILNGDKKTGVTTMYMDEGMDTGDIILQKEVEIDEDETTGELWDELAEVGGDLLVETLRKIEEGTATRTKQGKDFSMAPMLSKEMSKIDWENKTAEQIKNLVRGLNPIMGAYTFLNGKKIKFWKVEIVPDSEYNQNEILTSKNGTVIKSDPRDGLIIKTKEGLISVLEIQGENAKKMDIHSFLRGNHIKKFEVFE